MAPDIQRNQHEHGNDDDPVQVMEWTADPRVVGAQLIAHKGQQEAPGQGT
ncbi:hypothetical protein [Dictyobacter halimunensis]